jgi:transcriptional regulatory protein LevR
MLLTKKNQHPMDTQSRLITFRGTTGAGTCTNLEPLLASIITDAQTESIPVS